MILVGMVGLAFSTVGGLASRFPIRIQSVLDYQQYAYGPDARLGTCWFVNEPTFEEYPRQCYLDARTATAKGVLVWGDSHAARLYPGLRAVLGSQANLAQFTRSSCPATLNVGYGNCNESNRKILAEIQRTKPHTVILFGAWPNYDRKWGKDSARYLGLRQMLLALKTAGVREILLLGPAPKWKAGLPSLIYQAWARGPKDAAIPLRLPASNIDPATWPVEASLRSLALELGVSYFSVLDAFCNGTGCLTHVPGDESAIVSWDGQHLTTPGAIFVTRKLKDAGLL
jgi:hypothetical protein